MVRSRITIAVDPAGRCDEEVLRWCGPFPPDSLPAKIELPPLEPTINNGAEALSHYLTGMGRKARMGDEFIAKFKLYRPYQDILNDKIPQMVRAMVPRRCSCCPLPRSVTRGDHVSSIITAPYTWYEGMGYVVEPSYSLYYVSLSIGSINRLEWEIKCDVGTNPNCNSSGCRAYAKNCKVHFKLEDEWTFKTEYGKDTLFQLVFGDILGGQAYPVYAEWDEAASPAYLNLKE